mgnify:CR=1 FL=1
MARRRYDKFYQYYLWLTHRLTDRQLMMVLAAVVGLAAGLGTYIFEILLHFIRAGLVNWFPVERAQFLYLIYPAVGIILATLFVKYVVKDNISEGVTRVLYAMSRSNSRIRGHNCWTSVVGGATTIGFGGSVGPEAPIVLTGAAIGSNIGKLARLNYKNVTLLLCCGAGAALAAIFKAPITGVVFVLEILMLDITIGSVTPLLIASLSATTLALTLRGFDPILPVTLSVTDKFELAQIPMFIILGVLCGLMSYYFTSVNTAVGRIFRRIDSQYKKWAVGGVLIGVLIFIFPPLYGEGYEAMTGVAGEEVTLDTAMDELITTGEIAEDIATQTGGDSEQIEELIAFVKANVAAGELKTEEDVLAVIAEGEKKFEVTLTQEQKQQIVDIMMKINELGLDPQMLIEQAEDLYGKFGTDFFQDLNINLDELNLDNLNLDGLDTEAIEEEISKQVSEGFIAKVVNAIKEFFAGIFS